MLYMVINYGMIQGLCIELYYKYLNGYINYGIVMLLYVSIVIKYLYKAWEKEEIDASKLFGHEIEVIERLEEIKYNDGKLVEVGHQEKLEEVTYNDKLNGCYQ